ncbi:diguanylate cyclase with GAF sensor [Paraburkholderia sp. GV068]|uniref:sensor domain-containing diguanylate cyclase n=1 Tax=Paraburkholderia TaxID=1822464 RepID=UPI000D30882B|nr:MULTISPECIES: sensor domain-containing diguanylate cyclase [unclassified Paraburkholderia]PTR03749.1 diguanylate cyclase with GAF sensor [Paraburkholderia sp. GV072]PUB08707.1 diguanylate cyclase with GAF sensor [Paraburkholderia sp. GV068]
MHTPPIPSNESTRLDTLRALHILDTPPEERFDRLTRLAKRLFGVPIALVSLVDANRQWFKSCVGLTASETSRDVSFCAHAILDDDILAVPDTLADERFHDNPLVTEAPNIRFYAGCPLTVPNGSRLGTLCLIDVKPRELDDEERELLRDLARMAEQELAAVQLATLDDLTLLSNRRGFSALAQHALNVCKRLDRPASLLFFDLNDFKRINDTFGHAEGDRALKTFADVLRGTLRESDVIGRLGGDEFVVLLSDTDAAATQEVTERLTHSLDERNAQAQRGYSIRFSVGQIEYDAARHGSIAELLSAADAAMYSHKQASKARAAREA